MAAEGSPDATTGASDRDRRRILPGTESRSGSTSEERCSGSTILNRSSPDAKADTARSPKFADGMSRGQTSAIGTKHQPTKAPTLPRSQYRRSGATTAQPNAVPIAKKSSNRRFSSITISNHRQLSVERSSWPIWPWKTTDRCRHHRRGAIEQPAFFLLEFSEQICRHLVYTRARLTPAWAALHGG